MHKGEEALFLNLADRDDGQIAWAVLWGLRNMATDYEHPMPGGSGTLLARMMREIGGDRPFPLSVQDSGIAATALGRTMEHDLAQGTFLVEGGRHAMEPAQRELQEFAGEA